MELSFKTRLQPFRLRSRASLVAATVAVQAAVLGVCGYVAYHKAESGISSNVTEEVMEDIRGAAVRFADRLSNEIGAPIRHDSHEWERAQAIVERTHLPRGAFVSLLDMENRILCHPALKNNPRLSTVDFSEQEMMLSPSNERVTVGAIFPRSALTGRSDFPGGPAGLAMVYRPDLHVKVLVHQPGAGIAAAGDRVTNGMFLTLGGAGLVVLMLTGLGSYALIKRYDSMLMQINRDLEAEVSRKMKSGLTIRNALIFGLAKLADYRDTDTGAHLERISRYCELLANELRPEFEEIDDAWVERLRLASSMHDIGKVGIPDSILLKPGMFTQEERRLMEQHPLIGADTLVAIRTRVGDDALLNMGIQVALYHHERFDGTGYPFGLAGEDIPLEARVVALADMYDALTSHRVYKKAMNHEQARSLILLGRGTHHDPRIVDAFDRINEKFETTRRELQPENETPEKPHLVLTVEQAAQCQRRMAA